MEAGRRSGLRRFVSISHGCNNNKQCKSGLLFVEATTARLNFISEFFKSGKMASQVGTVLTLEDARLAHPMLAGAAHARG
jgi:hypothetical protein